MDLPQQQEQLAGAAVRFGLDLAVDDGEPRVQVPGETVNALVQTAREGFVGEERALRIGQIEA